MSSKRSDPGQWCVKHLNRLVQGQCMRAALCGAHIEMCKGWRNDAKEPKGNMDLEQPLWLMQPRGKTELWRSTVASAKARFPPQAFSLLPL